MNLIQKHIKNSMDLVRNFSLTEVVLFKIIMVISGLFLAKLFPVLTSGNIWIYVVIIFWWSAVLLRNM